jgi:hypothetical protein
MENLSGSPDLLSAPSLVTQIIAGQNITIDQPNGNVTINSSGGGGGEVYQATYYKSANQNLTNGATDLTFDEEGSWNNSNGLITHTSGSTDFVVVQAGLYQLEFNVTIFSNGAGWTNLLKQISVDITRSPTAEVVTIAQNGSMPTASNYGQSLCSTFSLEAGDVINCRVVNTFTSGTPTAQGVTNTIDLNTWFTWRYVGGGGVDGGGVVSIGGLDGAVTLSSPDSSINIGIGNQDIELSSNGVMSIVAGDGIAVQGDNAEITITNLGVTSISDGTTPATGAVTLEAGSGVSILNTAGTFVFENTGVLELTGGDGIGLDVQTGSVTVSNLGLLTATAGTGISTVTAAGDVTITNDGVLSIGTLSGSVGIVSGDGISVTIEENDLTISNTGITALDAGTGISVAGSTITNDGVLTVAALTGAITLSATGMTITPAGQNIDFSVPAAPVPSINAQTGPITISAEAGMGVVTAGGTIGLYNVARPYTLLGATIGGVVTNVIGFGSGNTWPATTFNLASTIQINVPPTYSAGQSVMFDGFAYYNFTSTVVSFWAIYYVTSTQSTEQSLIGVKLANDSIAAPASVAQIYLPMNLTIPPGNLVPGGTITIRVYGYLTTSGEYLSDDPLINARVGLVYP